MGDMFDLSGKRALITGATGGIGGAIARTFASAGAAVGLSGRNKDKLNELTRSIKTKTHTFELDLSDLPSVETFVDTAWEAMGGIDILVCNAGTTKDALNMRMKLTDFTSVVDVNLTSTFILNRDVCKKMLKNKFGRVINISSIIALIGNPGQTNYSASKAAIIAMTKTLAAEYATRGITANCIAPGFIETPMTDVLSGEQKQLMLSRIPIGRFGSPQDVANVALFLASNEASYITGQTIHTNGGMLMV